MTAGAVYVSRIPYPHAGEPIVMAAIPPVEELQTSSTEPEAQEASPAEEETATEAQAEPDPPPEEMPAEQTYDNEPKIIVAARRPLKAAPVAAVAEETPDGVLPRISKNGKKPSDVYAQITPLAVSSSNRPKIAILLGGMGLNAKLTQKAIKELPGDVTFGFAPYGENLQKQANQARANGHEILLQVPMEPMGYPGSNPGPQTLLADAPADENIKALHWHMSRFAGYTGITNYMGSRLLSSAPGLQPIMLELRKRGLVFLEDATAGASISSGLAESAGVNMRRASAIIDINPDASAIAAELEKLEKEAIANGIAVGTGSGLEVTIETVADWAKSLEDKGIILIPVSAAFKGRMG
jgi:hypothetical protein